MDEARCPVVTASAGYGDPYRELCGLPLVQDGACQTCGRPDGGDETLFHDPRAVRNAGKRDYIHPYAPQPASCPVHGVPATKEGGA